MYVHVITGKVVEPCLGTTEALRSHRFLVFMWSWIYRYVFPHSEHQFSDLQNGSTLPRFFWSMVIMVVSYYAHSCLGLARKSDK